MGTNFYHHEKPPCATCGHETEPRHIGKSSHGWCFSLHVYPDEGINDLADWRARWASGVIRDEYGEVVNAWDMERRITDRGRPEPHWDPRVWGTSYEGSEAEFHRHNHSQRGPAGLLRHRLDGHCIKHGEGTWDCIVGEFS